MLVTFFSNRSRHSVIFHVIFLSFTRSLLNFSLDSCSRHFASFGRQNHVCMSSSFRTRANERNLVINRQESITDSSSFIEENDSPDEKEKKMIRKKSSTRWQYLANGSELSYRAESFIFAKNKTHPELTF